MIKLLFVDDERGITDALKDFFEAKGFMVDSALSGEEAMKKVTIDKPDIVFLDIRMKGMDGIDTLTRIKKADNKIKVIMLTAFGDKESAEKARSLGADEYITKPFRIDYLDDVVIKKIQEVMKERK